MQSCRQLAALLLVVACLGRPAADTHAQATGPVPGACSEGTLPSGALSLFCIPASGWNGDLAMYAHGYINFDQPLDFYNLTLGDGTYLPDLIQQKGSAFATTSYRQNGLAVLEGVDDLRELLAAFPAVAGRSPAHSYILGVSEGGLISTLLLERFPELVNGGLAACGPVGDFQRQVDYFSDFRVLFDYFFPGVGRYAADRAAQDAIKAYQTSGQLVRPLVIIHTTADQIVPYEQATLYAARVHTSGQGRFTLIPVERYSHCNFTTPELTAAFDLLVQQASNGQRIYLPLAIRN